MRLIIVADDSKKHLAGLPDGAEVKAMTQVRADNGWVFRTLCDSFDSDRADELCRLFNQPRIELMIDGIIEVKPL